MLRRSFIHLAVLAAVGAFPASAFAHPGVGAAHGFAHGLAHPVSGVDHVLAMVTVGLFAAKIGARAVWAVPLTFLTLMAFGGALGLAGVEVPLVETGIALSVVVLGIAVALNWHWPVAAAMALVGTFAIFHGHAHGAEMPDDASGAAYALGFLLITALLHVTGIGLGVCLARFEAKFSRQVARAAGAMVTLAGLGMLGGVF